MEEMGLSKEEMTAAWETGVRRETSSYRRERRKPNGFATQIAGRATRRKHNRRLSPDLGWSRLMAGCERECGFTWECALQAGGREGASERRGIEPRYEVHK